MRLLLILAAIFAISVAMLTHAEAQTAVKPLIVKAIVLEAQAQGVDPLTALAVAKVESGFNPEAVGAIGEIGLYQLRPEFFAIYHGETEENIRLGIENLKRMKALCASYGEAYFICHNYGPNRKIIEPRKAPYFQKVQQAKRELAPYVGE